jgi:Skp family chaperone for outer membrane proteins
MNRVFKELPETKDAEAQINNAKDEARKEYDSRSAAYKRALDEINSLNQQLEAPALSANARTQMAKERDDRIAKIKNMEREIKDFREKREKELEAGAVKARDRIAAKIGSAARACAERGRFDLVFDSSGSTTNGVPVLVMTHDLPDLSDAVIKECVGR